MDGPPHPAPPGPRARSRAWCFTFNNYPFVPTLSDFGGSATYLCYGHEFAPDTGTPHLQGYVYLRNAVSLAFVRAVVDGAHWEVARGSPAQNVQYCRKDGDFFEEGVQPAQGKRSDLDAVRDSILAGSSLRDIAQDHFAAFVRYNRGIGAVRFLLAPDRNAPPALEFHIGPPGTGKSRAVHQSYPGAYWKPPGVWWDGYDGESVVIIDEFYGSQYPYAELLRLLDGYPLSVPVKGAFQKMRAERICFTSNVHPRDWYSVADMGTDWDHSALARRVREYGHIYLYHALNMMNVHVHPEGVAEGVPEGRRCPTCDRNLPAQGLCVWCHE